MGLFHLQQIRMFIYRFGDVLSMPETWHGKTSLLVPSGIHTLGNPWTTWGLDSFNHRKMALLEPAGERFDYRKEPQNNINGGCPSMGFPLKMDGLFIYIYLLNGTSHLEMDYGCGLPPNRKAPHRRVVCYAPVVCLGTIFSRLPGIKHGKVFGHGPIYMFKSTSNFKWLLGVIWTGIR